MEGVLVGMVGRAVCIWVLWKNWRGNRGEKRRRKQQQNTLSAVLPEAAGSRPHAATL